MPVPVPVPRQTAKQIAAKRERALWLRARGLWPAVWNPRGPERPPSCYEANAERKQRERDPVVFPRRFPGCALPTSDQQGGGKRKSRGACVRHGQAVQGRDMSRVFAHSAAYPVVVRRRSSRNNLVQLQCTRLRREVARLPELSRRTRERGFFFPVGREASDATEIAAEGGGRAFLEGGSCCRCLHCCC